MGRGLGVVQQRVLDVLTEVADQHEDAYVLLTTLAHQDDATRWRAGQHKVDTSQMESTRRAVRTLEQRGLVETGVIDGGPRGPWKVVRLKQHDYPALLPRELDEQLHSKLSLDLLYHNELLRRLGSRHRLSKNLRPHKERAGVLMPENGDSYYEVIHVHSEPTETRLSAQEQEGELHRLEREAEQHIESEVQRRVEEELQLRSGNNCTCTHKAEKSRSDPEFINSERMLELVVELAESAAHLARGGKKRLFADSHEPPEGDTSQDSS